MKFGLSLTGMLQQPAGTDMVRSLEEACALVRLAKEFGFTWLYAGQHFLSHPYRMLQPLPVMARLAAEAPGLDLVTTAVLPLHNPVDVAEQVATLDAISGGHAVLATALGYRDEENDAFGVARRDRVPRMLESLESCGCCGPVRLPSPTRAATSSSARRMPAFSLSNPAAHPCGSQPAPTPPSPARDGSATPGSSTTRTTPLSRGSRSLPRRPRGRRSPRRCDPARSARVFRSGDLGGGRPHRAALRLRQVRHLRPMGPGPGPGGRAFLQVRVRGPVSRPLHCRRRCCRRCGPQALRGHWGQPRRPAHALGRHAPGAHGQRHAHHGRACVSPLSVANPVFNEERNSLTLYVVTADRR